MDAQSDDQRLDEAEMGGPATGDEAEEESFPASDPPAGWAGPDTDPEGGPGDRPGHDDGTDPDTSDLSRRAPDSDQPAAQR